MASSPQKNSPHQGLSRRSVTTEIFDGFGGINTKKHHSTTPGDTASAYDVLNLRIGADGSLTKRQGYKHLANVGADIRAIFGGYIKDKYYCYYVAGSNICRFDIETGTSTVIGTSANPDSFASFIYHMEALYVIEDENIFRIDPDDHVGRYFGYVPLVGKDWPTGRIGEINEPLNLLHGRARFTYLVGDIPTPYLRTLYTPVFVSAVFLNGEQISSDEYKVNTDINAIVIQGLETDDRIEIHLTVSYDDPDVEALSHSVLGASFGAMNDSQLLLFGGKNADKVFFSKSAPAEGVERASVTFPDSGALYFPRGNSVNIGGGQFSARASSRHYDRLLIFTTGDTWMASDKITKDVDIPVLAINSSVGVESMGGATLAGNYPIAITKHGIYSFNSNTDEINEFNAYSISAPIDHLLDEHFLSTAAIYYDKKRHELLISGRSFKYSEEGDDLFLVYNIDTKKWVRFDTLRADRFFDASGEVGFTNGPDIYVFDDDLRRDFCKDDDIGKEITARYESNLLEFGTIRKKHLIGVEASCDLEGANGNAIKLEFSANGKSAASIGLVDDNTQAGNGGHLTIKKRLKCGRFENGSYTISITGDGRPTLHSIALKTR